MNAQVPAPQPIGQSMSAAFISQIRQKLQPTFDGLYASKPSTVTALPTIAKDGQVIRYRAQAATTGALADVVWVLTYDAASSYWIPTSAPLVAEVDSAAGETTTSTSYANLATVGPSLILPFAGDWKFTYGCFAFDTSTNSALMSVDFGGGGGAVDADEVAVGGTNAMSASRIRVKAIPAASTTVTAKYRTGPAGTATYAFRFLNAEPMRVH